MTKTYSMKGLDCPYCAVSIEKEIGELEGVESAVLNLVTEMLVVELQTSAAETIEWNINKIVRRHGHKVDIREIGGESKKVYLLKGLDCPNCSAKIEREVSELECISSAQINLVNQTLAVEYKNVSEFFLDELVSDIVHSHEPDVEVSTQPEQYLKTQKADESDKETRNMIIRFAVGAVLYAAGLILPVVFTMPLAAKLAILIVAYIVLGFDVIFKAARNIVKGRIFDENFLMTLSTIGAFAIGEYPEAVAVMLFYQIGEFFQSLAVKRSRKSISELMDIRPDFANVSRNGELVVVSPETVAVGETIIVKPGEKIPLDGIVIEGEALLDTRALTGESVPRKVHTGDEALSGCINQNGVLAIRVTKAFGESTAAKIIDMVENASAKKAPTENFITKFARYYTPAVVIVAALLAVIPPLFFNGDWAEWIRRGCVFLVISCPCALVISIPLTFFGGIGAASRHGVLVKGSNYLEALNNISTVVFDKTGTLTKGVFNVVDVIPAAGYEKAEVLSFAAKAEVFSNHPIAKSIIFACGEDHDGSDVSEYKEISGHGISVIADGKRISVGNTKLMETQQIEYVPCEEVGTKVYISVEDEFVGCIVIADEIKPDSENAICLLKKNGVEKTVMLTGDNEIIAEHVAQELGVDEYHAQLLPEQKVEMLEQIDANKRKGSKLAFVGDGINDAPVLARADIGIAMGGLGSDAAIEAADVVLMTDEPSKLVEAIGIAKHTKRIVIQNIIIALGIKGIFLILGAFGIAGMWEAVFSDVGVALIAVLNAMRIIRK